jgi:hypothetical protein
VVGSLDTLEIPVGGVGSGRGLMKGKRRDFSGANAEKWAHNGASIAFPMA